MLIRPTDAAPRPDQTRPALPGAWQVLLTIEAGAGLPALWLQLDGVAPGQPGPAPASRGRAPSAPMAAPEGLDGVHSWPGGS